MNPAGLACAMGTEAGDERDPAGLADIGPGTAPPWYP